MNYNDQILENKTFNFVKELMYNIALSFVIVLAFCLLFVYGFKYSAYNVISGSMSPEIQIGDMVVVHKAAEYKVGDVLKFTEKAGETPTIHRIIAIRGDSYICHGDAVHNDSVYPDDKDWQYLVDLAKNLSTSAEIRANIPDCQDVSEADGDYIEGKVVAVAANYGNYISFIQEHKTLFITIVLGLWCFSYVVKNEIGIKHSFRMFK